MSETLSDPQQYEVAIEGEGGGVYTGRITGKEIAYEERGEVTVYLTEDERVIAHHGDKLQALRARGPGRRAAGLVGQRGVCGGDDRARREAGDRLVSNSAMPAGRSVSTCSVRITPSRIFLRREFKGDCYVLLPRVLVSEAAISLGDGATQGSS